MQKQDFEKVNQDVDGKIDRNELDAFRDYMEKQLKKLKKLAVSVVCSLISEILWHVVSTSAPLPLVHL